MAEASQVMNSNTETTITTLDEDSLVKCASYLSIIDVSNLAMSSKFLKRVAYSDSIWLRFFREQWPQEVVPSSTQVYRTREAYLARFDAVHKFGFYDPVVVEIPANFADLRPIDHVLMDKHELIFSQGSSIYRSTIDSLLNENENSSGYLINKHKGSCQRCFKGHNGPVSTLSDKLLGNENSKVLASGGEDGTVRLWSLSSNGKRGQHTPKATLYGHQKPVKLMTVAEHKNSLLATVSTDSKVRVWDATVSSAARSSCCVGTTCVHGAPIDMKRHESLLFIAAGCSVVAVDLRTMQKVMIAASCEPKLFSAAVLLSKSLICTGGNKKAMIWDIRRDYEPVAELDGHVGPVTQLHMDQYKIVTGGPKDLAVMVWEPSTGKRINILPSSSETDDHLIDAMAANGTRIAIASTNQGSKVVSFRDFFDATHPVTDCFNNDNRSEQEHEYGSKFWDPEPYNDDSDIEI